MRKPEFSSAHRILYYGLALLSVLILFTFFYFSYVVFLNTITEVTYFYIIMGGVSILILIIFGISIHHGRKGAVVKSHHKKIRLVRK